MFISGYASDVWIQRETAILGPSLQSVLQNKRLSLFTIEADSKNRLTRTGPNYRISTFKTLQGVVNIKLRFELRLTSPICELLRSLLSLYACASDSESAIPVQARTWQAELVDQVSTVKLWIKDQNTGEGYFFEGAAVSEAEITAQSRQIAVITFGLIALRTTYLPIVNVPGPLDTDPVDRPIVTGDKCGAYFTPTDFTDDLDSFIIPGTTRSTMRISRELTPSRFIAGLATRFSKLPAVFTGAVDCRINSDLRSFLSQDERYGAAVFKFAQDSNYWIEALLPSVALTYDEAQLQSPTDTPSLTITVYSIEDMTLTGGDALRLYRAPESIDGGNWDPSYLTSPGVDGGNWADSLAEPLPSLDGGDNWN